MELLLRILPLRLCEHPLVCNPSRLCDAHPSFKPCCRNIFMFLCFTRSVFLPLCVSHAQSDKTSLKQRRSSFVLVVLSRLWVSLVLRCGQCGSCAWLCSWHRSLQDEILT